MNAPYLVEVRTGGDLKAKLRSRIDAVADEFGIRGVADPRPVPHVPLFGRYDTRRGPKVKERLVDVFSRFDVVPYRVSGFGAFEQPQLVYAHVVPSPELCVLRRRIADALEPLTSTHKPSFERTPFQFHIPVASDDAGRPFDTDAVLEFLRTHHDLTIDDYATRVTNLDGRRMLWEYDLLQDAVLSHGEATSRPSWQRTNRLLAESSTPKDHERLVTYAIGSVIAQAAQLGWAYFSEPHVHVTDRARRDGLYQADGSMGQRQLYVAENYAYLVVPLFTGTEEVNVRSIEKGEFYDATVEAHCPICESTVRQYEDDPGMLPCPSCGFQLPPLERQVGFESLPDGHAEMCVRCHRLITDGGVKFDTRVYCDACVDRFEAVADEGVVVQSRHGKADADERPYVVQWGDSSRVEENQVAALARGKELADSNALPALFIYRKNGSHWLLDTYLDAHESIKSTVESKRREIRGEQRLQIDPPEGSQPGKESPGQESAGHEIRASGDVVVAETVIEDAVINRSDIGTRDQSDDQ